MVSQKKSYKSIGLMSQSSEILEPLESTTYQQLTLFAAVSLVKTSARPRLLMHKGLMVKDRDSGKSSIESFASYDTGTHLWKTSQLCFTEELEEFSETWPQSGMMRSGKCYELVTSDCPTDESDCLLLPTPTKGDVIAS